MLGRRSPQGALFRPDHTLRGHVGADTLYGLLARRGGEWFRDEDFVGLYREDFGRPSVSPAQLCIALLLQTYDGVSDEEAIERTAYDLRWKVALGLELGEKLCAKSTLQLFRAKLVLHEAYGIVFERSVRACREAGLLGRGRKLAVAIDTTPVLGRGAVKDTYNLVSEAIRRVVQAVCDLKGWDEATVVAEHGLGRHFAASFKGAVELDWSDPAARRALVGQLVADARVALALAATALRGYAATADATRAVREARALLADLLAQDIEEDPADGAGPQIVRGTARDRIISTTDPGMRHGHKSHAQPFDGYKATVVADTAGGVILATDVLAGNVPDREGAPALVAAAAATAERPLGDVLGDTAYGDMQTRAELAALGATVVAKAPPGKRGGLFGLDDFRFEARREVAICPAGKGARRQTAIRGAEKGWRYRFSAKDCGPCPLRAQCTPGVARTVYLTRDTRALQRLRRVQTTQRFRTRYRRRIVVEHRIARLVQLGIRQARYLGRAKVRFQVALAATVANLGLVLAILGGPLAAFLLIAIVIAALTAFRSAPTLARWRDAALCRALDFAKTAGFRPDF